MRRPALLKSQVVQGSAAVRAPAGRKQHDAQPAAIAAGVRAGAGCMLSVLQFDQNRLRQSRPMNIFILWKVFERMHGRTLASVVAAASENTDGQVCEKTVRNWFRKRTTPDPETLERLVAGGRENMHKKLEAQAWPVEARQAYDETLSRCPGLVSSVVASLQNGDAKYPASIEFASQVDRLELALDAHRANDNLEEWVRSFLEADWLRDEHLTHPDDGTSADETRRLVREAKTWADLTVPLAVYVTNVQFQLLATLDLEFCSRYLVEFEATPIFASLLPRLNPRIASPTGTPSVTRDLFHYPTRRLLDITACMRALRASRMQNWPVTVPSVTKMTIWLDLVEGGREIASNLPKWRSGRTISTARFEALWNAYFEFVPETERPPTPDVMLYAVAVFTELFVKGSREDRNLTFIAPDPAFYRHWWNLQNRKLSTGAEPLRFGTKKWMPSLD
jgi:hypothetical protein